MSSASKMASQTPLLSTLVFLLLHVLLCTNVQAHGVYLESDLAYQPVTSPEVAKVIIGYLEEGEVDMYTLLVTPDDITPHDWGPKLVNMCMISANALPPACKQYKKFHPSLALIGPRFPPPKEDLPFEIPVGYGVIVAHNPKDNSVKRPIYTEHPELLNSEIDRANSGGCSIDKYMTGSLSWFLAYGLTQDCLHCSQWTCDFSNSLGVPVFFPSIYYIAVFDPTGRAGDYALNMGIAEREESCEDLQRTVDIVEGIIDGSVYRKKKCVSAGESNFVCCDLNRNEICDDQEEPPPWP